MNTKPTPEEAQQALREVDHRQAQTSAAAAWPRWVWIAGGAVVAAYGILADTEPRFVRTWGTTVVVLLLVASMAVNTRRGGGLLGRQVRPRVARDPSSLLGAGLVFVLFVGAAVLLRVLDVPHAALWTSLPGGVLLAVAGPWWERRVLSRAAGR